MADRYAMVRDGKVENVVLWDGDSKTWQPPAGVEMVKSDDAAPGDGYDDKDGSFTPAPSPPTPAKSRDDRLLDKLVEKNLLTRAEADSIAGAGR